MVFDAHSDIWTNITLHSLQGETDIFHKYHKKSLEKGGIEGGIFAIWIDSPHNVTRPYERLQEIIAAIKKEISISKDFVVVKNMQEIKKAKEEGKFYVLIGIEGLSPIGENIDLIDLYYDIGARHAMLTWNEENALATGAKGNTARGLTNLGKKAVEKLLSKKMILDVSHLNEASFWDITQITEGPVIASHSNAKALCDVPRNLSDTQLFKLRDLHGVIGLNAFEGFVHVEAQKQTIDTLVQHAVYIAEKIGAEHIGCGFDFFDFFSPQFHISASPCVRGLENCSKVPVFLEKLEKAGFCKKEIEGICFKNFHRVIKQVLS